MPRRKSSVERIYEEMIKEASHDIDLNKWRAHWFEKGPIEFAEKVLTSPDDCPPYPKWEELQKEEWCEGCKKEHLKFNPYTGVPYHLILSKEQKEFLYDVWKGGVDLAILAAGRGAGKTLILAVFDCWLLVCQNNMEISALAGSGKQSKILQKYINQWRSDTPLIKICLPRSLRGTEPKITTNTGGEINFLPCSRQSVRGPHVPIVQIDECCVAEESSEEGREATESIWYQIVGKRNAKIFLTSTAHYIFGKFYEYLTHPEAYGFKAYTWAIANHISGKRPEATFKDRNPDHWVPAVWWVTRKDIEILRKKDDASWLCEALGRPSLASGQIFSKVDMDFIICNGVKEPCEECYPYRWDDMVKCPLIDKMKLGDRTNPTRQIIDRRGGYDHGDPAPCALTILGRKGQVVFVLYSDERKNLPIDDNLSWITTEMRRWNADVFIPDPSISTKYISRKIDEKGYAVYIIGEAAKGERVDLTKRIVERHAIVIPKAYWKLITSMRQLAWDKNGKIRKYNDHSYDTIQYGVVDWEDIIDEFEGVGGGIWGAVLGRRAVDPVSDKDIMRGIKLW